MVEPTVSKGIVSECGLYRCSPHLLLHCNSQGSSLVLILAVAWRWTYILDTSAHHWYIKKKKERNQYVWVRTMMSPQLPNVLLNPVNEGMRKNGDTWEFLSSPDETWHLEMEFVEGNLCCNTSGRLWSWRCLGRGRKLCCQQKNILQHLERLLLFIFFCQLLGNLPIYIAQYSQSESSGFSSLLAYKVKEQ